MISLKEQAEIFRLGLLIGNFSVKDVITWADYLIEYEDSPEMGLIEVSLSESKGINDVIAHLDNINGKYNHTIPIKTILGLLYKELSLNEEIVSEIARKLYVLSLNISPTDLEEDKINQMNTMDDIFYISGWEDVAMQIKDLLEEYEEYADNFNELLRMQNFNKR